MEPRDPPPTSLQRRIAQHAVGLQVVLVCLATGATVLFTIVLASDGWGVSAISPGIIAIVLLGLTKTPRHVARFVTAYDREQGHGLSDSPSRPKGP